MNKWLSGLWQMFFFDGYKYMDLYQLISSNNPTIIFPNQTFVQPIKADINEIVNQSRT